MSVRHDWYQSEASVVISVLLKNAKDRHAEVKIEKDRVDVTGEVLFCYPSILQPMMKFLCPLSTADDYTLSLALNKEVDVEKSSYKMLSSKIEISLAKIEGVRWDALEKQDKEAPKPAAAVATSAPVSTGPPSHPGSKKNWDKMAKEIEEKEAGELQGEQALQALFQKIYGDSSDEVRKAMNKSYYESGGTVLSTNWKEVAEAKVDVKPPDGTEFKKWEG